MQLNEKQIDALKQVQAGKTRPKAHVKTLDALVKRRLIAYYIFVGYVMTAKGHEVLANI